MSRVIAQAVSRQAVADGVAPARSDDELDARIARHVWEPVYRTYRAVTAA